MHSKKYTNDNLVLPADMTDTDKNEGGVEAQFKAGADMKEGVSGRKSIDSSFENFSQDTVDTPRSGINAPVDLNLYPHREK